MSQSHAPSQRTVALSGNTVCAQAARILRVTAMEWGMCAELRHPVRKVQRTPCGGLQALLRSSARLAT